MVNESIYFDELQKIIGDTGCADIINERWPEIIGLESVREFDNLTKKFYRIFDDDLNESRKDSELCMGTRREIFRQEEVVVVKRISYSGIKPKERKVRRKVEPVSVPAKRVFDNANQSTIKGEQDTSEDIIVTNKKVKPMSQLPIINKKENIKVVTHDDNSLVFPI